MALRRDPPARVAGLTEPELYRRSFGRVKVNLGDLDDLVALLRERTSHVVLRAGRALADEAEDFREATTTELEHVTIVTAEPDVTVRLGHGAEVSTTSASIDAAKALVDDVHALLSQRQNPWVGSKAFFMFAGVGLFGAFILVAGRLINPGGANIVPPALLLLGFGILFGLVVWRDHVKGGIVVVEPARTSEARSRNQDKLVIAANVVASSVVTFFLTYWQVAAK